MKPFYRFSILLMLSLFMTGCYEETQQMILNPDGSGKVRIEIVRAASIPMNMTGQGETDFDPQAALRETAKAIIDSSKGIDTWGEVSFDYQKDGRMFFRGTAYFPALADLDIQSLSGKNSKSSSFGPGLKLRKVTNGFELIRKQEEKKDKQPASGDLFKEKIKYQQMRGMLAAALTGLHTKRTIELPAKPVEYRGFQLDGRKVHDEFDGEKALALLDQLLADDTMMQKLADDGKGMDDASEWLQEELFGSDFYVRVEGPMKDHFNYDRAVAKATKRWAKSQKKLFPPVTEKKVGKKSSGPKVKAGEKVTAGDIRVAAVTMNLIDHQAERNLPLFSKRSLKTKIVASLPVALTDIGNGIVIKAVSADGQKLLQDDEWHRKINFPKLSDDGHYVVADLPDLLLPEGFNGKIGEISGEFTGMISSAEKTVDLGILDVRKGSTGKQYSATISEVGESKWQKDKYDVSLKLELETSYIKDFVIFDSTGKALEFKPAMTQSGKTTTKTFQRDAPWPEKIQIKVIVHDKIVEHKIPFKMESVDLFK